MENAPISSPTITGVVIYRARIALLPGSVISVQLLALSEDDAPSWLLAETTLTTTGENVPIPFVLGYDPAQIDARRQYALNARIHYRGQMLWVNSSPIWVLTGGAPSTDVTIGLQRP
jgi:putative lipoprotein